MDLRKMKCSGCDREYDAVQLILFGHEDIGGLYCSMACAPPFPKPANATQWVRMQLGMWFTATDGSRCRFG